MNYRDAASSADLYQSDLERRLFARVPRRRRARQPLHLIADWLRRWWNSGRHRRRPALADTV